jgi:hypothetical protein
MHTSSRPVSVMMRVFGTSSTDHPSPSNAAVRNITLNASIMGRNQNPTPVCSEGVAAPKSSIRIESPSKFIDEIMNGIGFRSNDFFVD